MSKPKTPRDVQVRHRLSGAALLGVREPNPPTMAIDAAPRAGDPRPLRMRGTFGDEEMPPVVTEIDDNE